MNIWFISDHHFGHARFIQLAHRPFASVEEIDKAMIARWRACGRATSSIASEISSSLTTCPTSSG